MGSICLKIIFLKASVPAQRDGFTQAFLTQFALEILVAGTTAGKRTAS
jgi:hypothetical protein